MIFKRVFGRIFDKLDEQLPFRKVCRFRTSCNLPRSWLPFKKRYKSRPSIKIKKYGFQSDNNYPSSHFGDIKKFLNFWRGMILNKVSLFLFIFKKNERFVSDIYLDCYLLILVYPQHWVKILDRDLGINFFKVRNRF